MKHIFLKRIALMGISALIPCAATAADPAPDTKDPALSQMETIRDIVIDYHARHNAPISSSRDISKHISDLCKEGKFPSYQEMMNRLYVNYGPGLEYAFRNPYSVRTKRLDDQPYTSPKAPFTKDMILYNDKLWKDRPDGADKYQNNPQGFFMVLWDDYSISKVPYDMLVYVLKPTKPPKGADHSASIRVGFQGQPGLLVDGVSYDDKWSQWSHMFPPIGKRVVSLDKKAVADNGVDSLVILSRQVQYPDVYGIDREKLWQEFNPTQATFTLEDMQIGAGHLGLKTEVSRMSLDELQRTGTPALLCRKDDGRLITLVGLDDDAAVVVSKGMTQVVYRSTLEKVYSGEALIPEAAVAAVAALHADDPVRIVQLASLDDEVTQQVTLRNTGTQPITMHLEYPLLGVSEAKLSADSLAPGEKATLDLKMKWRPVLQTPIENVKVSLQTSDPIRPHLQLVFSLVAPKKAAAN